MSGGWEGLIRPEVLGLRAYAAEGAGGLIKLDANENPHPTPPEVVAAVCAAASAIELNRYPDPHATALRGLLAKRSGWTADGVLLGNGSDDLIVLLLAACGGPGATLLVPTPTFSMYRHSALTLGWRVEEVPLTESFGLDEPALTERASKRPPRLSIFATPNNPTGNRFDPLVLERYVRSAPGLVVIDEAYQDFCGGSLVRLLQRHRNLVVLQTLSKIGLAALRLGVLLADPGLVAQVNKVRLPYNVGSFPQSAALTILQRPEFLESQVRTIVEERQRLAAGLARLPGVTTFPSDANFILVRTVHPSREIFAALRDRGVLVRDLGGVPGPLHNCLRVTVGTRAENDSCLEALAHVLPARSQKSP